MVALLTIQEHEMHTIFLYGESRYHDYRINDLQAEMPKSPIIRMAPVIVIAVNCLWYFLFDIHKLSSDFMKIKVNLSKILRKIATLVSYTKTLFLIYTINHIIIFMNTLYKYIYVCGCVSGLIINNRSIK